MARLHCAHQGCGKSYTDVKEPCEYHPGLPVAYEDQIGWDCCQNFIVGADDFMSIPACTIGFHNDTIEVAQVKSTAGRQGPSSSQNSQSLGAKVEILPNLKADFQQTPTSVIARFKLKRISKKGARIDFTDWSILLDLQTSGSPCRRYTGEIPLFAAINPNKCKYHISSNELEVTLAKVDVRSWPVLSIDDLYQIGGAQTS